MNRYKLLEQIGDGSFGRVMKAKKKETGEMVAVKHIKQKFKDWKSCINLREVQSLRVLSHPNLASLNEVIREKDESLYFVFEYMEGGSLYAVMKRCIGDGKQQPQRLSHDKIQSYLRQILDGLSYIHSRQFVHRDIKPENILVHGNMSQIKIADFGLARQVGQVSSPLTYYISTRWYRAPEVILHCSSYGKPLDIFATGLILAELYSLRPLLPGISEVDVVNKLMKLLGAPSQSNWEEGVNKMKRMNFRLPDADESNNPNQIKGVSAIKATMPKDTPPNVAPLIRQLIEWNPTSRPDADEALRHEYFQSSNNNQSKVHKSKRVYSEREFETSTAPMKMFGQRNREKDHDQLATNAYQQPNTHDMHKVEEIVAEQSKPIGQQAARRMNKARLPKMEKQPPPEPENNEFSDYLSAFTNDGRNLMQQPTANHHSIVGNSYHLKGRSTAKKTKKTKRRGRYGGGSHRGRREVTINMSTLTESSNNIWGGAERGEAPACVSGDGKGSAEDNLFPDPFQCLE